MELLNKDISGIDTLYGKVIDTDGNKYIINNDMNLGENKISLQAIYGNSDILLINNSNTNKTVEIAGYTTKINANDNGLIQMSAKNINIIDPTGGGGTMNINNFLNVDFLSEINMGNQLSI